ncbi:MAG: hypothetical protein U1E83_10180 [Methylotetracoccus sp.]
MANDQIRCGDINARDCYHAEKSTQNEIAPYLFAGLNCTPSSPCCRKVGNNVDSEYLDRRPPSRRILVGSESPAVTVLSLPLTKACRDACCASGKAKRRDT